MEGDRTPERLQLAVDEAARSGDLQTTIEYASRLAEPDTRYSCGTSSASGIRVTEGGGGLGTGREGSFSLLFLSTAAVWCVPSSVPSVYSINYKRNNMDQRQDGMHWQRHPHELHYPLQRGFIRRAAAHRGSPASLHLAGLYPEQYSMYSWYQELRSLASCSCSILSSSPSE